MAAIPMKKKMIIRPSATEAPKRDAKKLLKKFKIILNLTLKNHLGDPMKILMKYLL
jgi:hypothetical protein